MTTTESAEVKALTLRLAAEEYEALRTFAFLAHKPISDVIRTAVREYLAGQGHRDAVQAGIDAVRAKHRKALDALADK